jgi:hypothetical protein
LGKQGFLQKKEHYAQDENRAQKYYIFLKKKRGEIKKIVIGR